MMAAMNAISEKQGDFTQISGDSLFPVINMLNAKYFILPLQDGQVMPLQNPFAFGNAWMVDKVDYVANANAELDGVGKADLHHVAVADAQFKDVLGESLPQDSTSKVMITAYQPNNLKYTAESKNGGVLVFSEVFYPGWTASVDGKTVEIGRVNYVLRAINLPPGKHEVVLDFHPQTVATTETVAYVAEGLLLLVFIGGIFMEWRRKKNVTETKAIEHQ
jgi:hypothetical protein